MQPRRKLLSTELNCFGNSIDVSDVQPAKTSFLNLSEDSSLPANVTVSSFGQSLNAEAAIIDIVPGIDTPFKFGQFANAFKDTVSYPSEITTSVIISFAVNAAPTDVIAYSVSPNFAVVGSVILPSVPVYFAILTLSEDPYPLFSTVKSPTSTVAAFTPTTLIPISITAEHIVIMAFLNKFFIA